MQGTLSSRDIEKIVQEAEEIASASYNKPEPTARQHAKLQSLQIQVNSELIRTIRHLDQKNSKLQKQVFILSVVATVAAVIALAK